MGKDGDDNVVHFPKATYGDIPPLDVAQGMVVKADEMKDLIGISMDEDGTLRLWSSTGEKAKIVYLLSMTINDIHSGVYDGE